MRPQPPNSAMASFMYWLAVCPDESYVRVASALDYLGAAPVRGASYGGSGERMTVSLQVRSHPQAQRQQ